MNHFKSTYRRLAIIERAGLLENAESVTLSCDGGISVVRYGEPHDVVFANHGPVLAPADAAAAEGC